MATRAGRFSCQQPWVPQPAPALRPPLTFFRDAVHQDEEAHVLTDVARKSLEAGIAACGAGVPFEEIGQAIEYVVSLRPAARHRRLIRGLASPQVVRHGARLPRLRPVYRVRSALICCAAFPNPDGLVSCSPLQARHLNRVPPPASDLTHVRVGTRGRHAARRLLHDRAIG